MRRCDEIASFGKSASQVAASGRLGKLPPVVLAHDPALTSDPVAADRWQGLQTELAELSSDGLFDIVAGASHGNHVSHAEAVVQALDSPFKRARVSRCIGPGG